MSIAKSVIAMTLILVLVYLVLVNYKGAAAVIKQGGASYGSAVTALQGR